MIRSGSRARAAADRGLPRPRALAQAIRELVIGGALVPALSVGPSALAQTVGPSPPTVATTINVPAGATIIVVGTTQVSTPGAMRAALVDAGGTLIVDPGAGPQPGPILFYSVNGTALETTGGTIRVPGAGLNVQTIGGHALLSNGVGSNVILDGATVTTTGVGSALVAINGGTLDATGVVVNNTATATSNVSAGHGAIAELGGTVNLHAGTAITTAAFNSVGLGASGVGSRVTADALIPVTLNGRGAMGIYLHDAGQVTLLPGSTLRLNGTSSVGMAVDNTTVAAGAPISGLTINLDGVGARARPPAPAWWPSTAATLPWRT